MALCSARPASGRLTQTISPRLGFCGPVVLLLCLIVALMTPQARGQDADVPTHDIAQQATLTFPDVLTYVDASGRRSLSDLPDTPEAWQRREGHLVTDPDAGRYWFWFRLSNSSLDTRRAVIAYSEVFLEQADFYVIGEREQLYQRNGLQVPVHDRAIKTRVPAIDIRVPAGESVDVYMAFTSKFPASFGVRIDKPAGFAAWVEWQSIGYAFFFGASIAIILYNLLLFASLRQTIYLVYSLHAFCATLFVARFGGFTLYTITDLESHYRLTIFTWLQVALMVEFTRRLLNTRALSVAADWILRGIIVFYLLVAVASFVNVRYYEIGIMGVLPLTTFVFLVGCYSVYRRNPLGVLYVVAQGAYLVGNFLIAGLSLGFFEHSFLTRYGFIVGSLIELVLFSLALGYRFRLIQGKALVAERALVAVERDNAATLQAKVDQQTSALKQSADQLRALTADYDGLLQSIHVGVGCYNHRSTLTYKNNAFEELAAACPALEEEIETLLGQSTENDSVYERVMPQPNSVSLKLRINLLRRFQNDGQFDGFWVVVEDLTFGT